MTDPAAALLRELMAAQVAVHLETDPRLYALPGLRVDHDEQGVWATADGRTARVEEAEWWRGGVIGHERRALEIAEQLAAGLWSTDWSHG